jgi:cytochrome P450
MVRLRFTPPVELTIRPGEMHKKLRRIILPAFGTQQINALAPIFERCANDVKDRWTQQVKVSGGEASINLSMDCSFGLLNAIGEGGSSAPLCRSV